jgi:hypothetical protein
VKVAATRYTPIRPTEQKLQSPVTLRSTIAWRERSASSLRSLRSANSPGISPDECLQPAGNVPSVAGRVRYAAPKAGAPWTAPGRSEGRSIAMGGSGGKTTLEGVPPSDDLPAIHPPFLAFQGTATGRLASLWATPSVSRPAGLHKLNLRGYAFLVQDRG